MFDPNDPLAAELLLLKEQPVAPRGGAKKPFRTKYGPEISFAKSGIFQFEWENPKNGKKLNKAVQQLKFLIIDGNFFFQQWDRTGDKVRMACTTVEHTIKTAEGETKGEGTWSIPYDRDEVVKRYNPVGSKEHEGKKLSCAECISLGLNEECGEQGSLIIYVLGWTNDEGDLVDVPTPFVANLRCPKSSGTVFRDYARKLIVERGVSFKNVVTVANIVPTFNGISNKLELHPMDPAPAELTAEATDAFTALKADADAKREKEREEWKAKNGNKGGGSGGGGAKKPAAAAASSKPAASSGDTDDGFNF